MFDWYYNWYCNNLWINEALDLGLWAIVTVAYGVALYKQYKDK